MKLSILKSVALVTFVFMGNAEAYVTPEGAPGLPSTYEACLAAVGCTNENTYASCLASAKVGEPWKTMCAALKVCFDEHSGDDATWRECIDAAQTDYQEAIHPEEGEPYVGESLPVSTNAADAHYEQKDPDHKGYMNAQE